MKNRFVKTTLILAMLLVIAMPAQAFAAEKSCPQNQTNASNSQISKIYSQLPQSAINKLMENFKNGKVDAAQLQNLLKQYCQKAPASVCGSNTTCDKATTCNNGTTCDKGTACDKVTTPSKPTTTAPSKPETTTPSKPETTTPSKPETTTPSKPETSAPDSTNQTPSNTGSASLGAYEQQVVDLVNKERAAAGLPALKVNTKLAAVAEKKAEDMRDKNYFSHTSPTYGSPFDMMKQFDISYTAAGENIAKGQKSPSEVMNGWMNSPGHKANILNSSYTEIGVGYVTDSNGTTYWVQQFIRP